MKELRVLVPFFSLLPEARRELSFERDFRMEHASALEQCVFALRNMRVWNATIDGTGRRTFLMVEKADAFGALARHDVIDVRGNGGMAVAIEFPRCAAYINRVVGTSRSTRAAVDTFFCN